MAALTMKSSFQKKPQIKTAPTIAGTKPSIVNNQLLVSTGVPSLDSLIGGGLAVGTVLLIEEDVYGTYSSLLLKFFLSEGCVHKHQLYIASNDVPPQDILNNLPRPVCYDVPQESNQPGEQDKGSSLDAKDTDPSSLQIAWRYQNLKIDSLPMKTTGSQLGHYYDLTKTISSDTLASVQSRLYTSCELPREGEQHVSEESLCCSYNGLLQDIQQQVNDGQFSTSSQVQQRNILLLGIQGLGSPQWGQSKHCDSSLLKFFYALRSILRSAYAACVVTVPTHLYQFTAMSHVVRIRNLCDIVVSLESFADTPLSEHPVYKEYHGSFHVVKSPRLNSLTHQHTDTSDLVFKLRRKRFTIEKLHMPPALQENVESETSNKSSEVGLQSTGGGCGSGYGSNKLDF